MNSFAPEAIKKVQKIFPEISDYRAIHYLINHENFALEQPVQDAIENIEVETKFNPSKTQAEEILQRYGKIKTIMQANCGGSRSFAKSFIYSKAG